MKWSPREDRPGALNIELNLREARVTAQAVAEFCMDRLQNGNEPLADHQTLLQAEATNSAAGLGFTLNYMPSSLRQLVEVMTDYETASRGTAAAESLNPSELSFPDLTADRLQAADLVHDLSLGIKDAVLAFEGRAGESVDLNEFIHEE